MTVVFEVNDFLHPLDLAARQQLESVPLLQKTVTKYQSLVTERRTRQGLLASAVRLGPFQLPETYKLLPPICAAFGIEVPELYLTPGPANAMTVGHTQTAIVIYSELLDCLADDEIQAVLAHECGHIMASHTLYREMALAMIRAGSSIASMGAPIVGQFAGMAVQSALLDWYRKSELTADRAAAAFFGDATPMRRALFHLIGVPKWMPIGPNHSAFMEQAEEFDRITEKKWDRFLSRSLEGGSTHPMPVIRMRELTTWSESTAFEQLIKIAKSELSDDRTGCTQCGHLLVPGWQFCQACGTAAS
jgi:Zn-dependent protease with chaperone function